MKDTHAKVKDIMDDLTGAEHLSTRVPEGYELYSHENPYLSVYLVDNSITIRSRLHSDTDAGIDYDIANGDIAEFEKVYSYVYAITMSLRGKIKEIFAF